MAKLKRLRTIAAKVETTVGTAESLTASEGAFNVYDPIIQPTIETEDREAQGSFNYLSNVPGARMGTATFRTEVSIGATTLPEWASTFFPACGWVESANVFTPRSEAPGANVKTLTLGVYQDGKYKSIAGAMGTFQMVNPTGRMVYFDWTFTGVWQEPTDETIISPTYPTDTPIRFASGTCTYASVDQVVEQVTFDAGNNVVMRHDPTTAGGYISALVTNRYPRITANPEAVLVATEDRYGDWVSASEGAFALTLNGPSSSSLAISAPKAQIINAQESDRDRIETDDLEWACNKNGATADEELSFTFTLET